MIFLIQKSLYLQKSDMYVEVLSESKKKSESLTILPQKWQSKKRPPPLLPWQPPVIVVFTSSTHQLQIKNRLRFADF